MYGAHSIYEYFVNIFNLKGSVMDKGSMGVADRNLSNSVCMTVMVVFDVEYNI